MKSWRNIGADNKNIYTEPIAEGLEYITRKQHKRFDSNYTSRDSNKIFLPSYFKNSPNRNLEQSKGSGKGFQSPSQSNRFNSPSVMRSLIHKPNTPDYQVNTDRYAQKFGIRRIDSREIQSECNVGTPNRQTRKQVIATKRNLQNLKKQYQHIQKNIKQQFNSFKTQYTHFRNEVTAAIMQACGKNSDNPEKQVENHYQLTTRIPQQLIDVIKERTQQYTKTIQNLDQAKRPYINQLKK